MPVFAEICLHGIFTGVICACVLLSVAILYTAILSLYVHNESMHQLSVCLGIPT
jgi:hypothetical protein